MSKWEVSAWTPNSTAPLKTTVEAEDEWRAVLATGRAGRIPVNVREIKVFPFPDAPRAGQ